MVGSRNVWLSVGLGLAMMPAAMIVAQTVSTDYDHTADFTKYHTYSFDSVETHNPLNVQRIKDAVNKELGRKNMQEVATGGDVTIEAIGSTKDEQEYNTFYSGLGGRGYGWGGWGGWGGRWGGSGAGMATTTQQQIPMGTLVLDMYDQGTHQMVWRGTARSELSGKPDKNVKTLNKAVTKMFNKFPPKAAQ